MTAVNLVRIDADKKMARFYKLDVQPTLFGEWAVIREWGRIGRGGTVRSTPYGTASDRQWRKKITRHEPSHVRLWQARHPPRYAAYLIPSSPTFPHSSCFPSQLLLAAIGSARSVLNNSTGRGSGVSIPSLQIHFSKTSVQRFGRF
ncbi:WGR domain-containing protein [Bradyrhizobium septentrionale]|uniref:WGR domain-containing protein n=1 Tax=Bradyrhizobium septentrionale TaxID=1404411 RepID=UPI0023DE72D4|nr:WGR domain-containing protein [Bradyrhizobium septentrionale]